MNRPRIFFSSPGGAPVKTFAEARRKALAAAKG